uniref:Uncharacterized protein n=1 Tax=Coccolithus braarudii TaxID=221442 RepID=A0A7S0Q4D2_9EUKA|mmetsp:Transcript_33960/g.72528  ORF Transcript_33960/g.72528 Transcript_33960/m.72528 type:complete len:129 (+) Transcript_33960:146-532(+)
MDGALIATLIGVMLGLVACAVTCVVCRIWRRNRYYRKVQRSLDEEEAAFQETLARNYQEESQLDAEDKEKLQMLESYMASSADGMGDDNDRFDGQLEDGRSLPTRAEDVDKFMHDLAAAASGSNDTRQ